MAKHVKQLRCTIRSEHYAFLESMAVQMQLDITSERGLSALVNQILTVYKLANPEKPQAVSSDENTFDLKDLLS